MARRPTRAVFGAAVALVVAVLAAACDGAQGRPGFLVLDRGSAGLVVVDRLLVARERHALELRRVAEGRPPCGVLGPGPPVAGPSVMGSPAERLVRLRADGRAEPWGGAGFEHVLDLEPDSGAGLLVLEQRADENVAWRVEPDGRRIRLLSAPGLTALAGGADEVLVGGRSGELVRVTRGGAVRTWVRREGSLVDLAGGPDGGGWWALYGSPAARLVALGPGLDVRRDTALESVLDGSPRGLALCRGASGPWVWGAAGALAFDPGGRLRGRFEALPALPLTAFLALEDGALAASAGALIELSPAGRVRRTQGGFAAVGGLVRAAGPGPTE